MSSAVLYIASGQRYIDEAVASARRVKELMPDVPVVLLTPDPPTAAERVFDTVQLVYVMPNENWFLRSTACFVESLRLGYDRLLYLDTDTFLCEPLYEVLGTMLDRFDLLGAHAPGRRTAPTRRPVPDAFPEFNIGVLAFRVNKRIRDLFHAWHNQFLYHEEIYGKNDQAPLREALWYQGRRVSFSVLPPEYNCRYQFGFFARYSLKVLHGRENNMAAVCKKLNQVDGMRVYAGGALNL